MAECFEMHDSDDSQSSGREEARITFIDQLYGPSKGPEFSKAHLVCINFYHNMISFANTHMLNMQLYGRKQHKTRKVFLEFERQREQNAPATQGPERRGLWQGMRDICLMMSQQINIVVHENRNWLAWTIARIMIGVFLMRYAMLFYISACTPFPKKHLTSTRELFGLGVNNLLDGHADDDADNCIMMREYVNCERVKSTTGLADYMRAEYGQFIAWDLAQLKSGNFYIDDVWMAESAPAFQISKAETIIYTYLFSSFIGVNALFTMTGLYKREFDIPVMAFLYEPRVVMFIMQQRLVRYLRQTREVCRANCTRPSRNAGSHNARPCRHIYSRHFRYYLSVTRRPEWRNALLVILPILIMSVSTFFFVNVLTLSYYFHNLNAPVYERNMQLAQVLRAGHINATTTCGAALDAMLTACDTSHDTGGQSWRVEFANQVARYIANTEAGASLVQVYNQQSNVGDASQLRTWLADRIEPRALGAQWLVPCCCIELVVSLATVYFSFLCVTMYDLSLWLLEIRHKLDVCKALARTQNDELASVSETPSLDSQQNDDEATRETQSGDDDESNKNDLGTYNMTMAQLLMYLTSGRRKREQLCHSHAHSLIEAGQLACDKFTLSTYLDFRVFKDEVDNSRVLVERITSNVLFHSINLLLVSTQISYWTMRLSFIIIGLVMLNGALMINSVFASQSTKLNKPIHSIIASRVNDLRHMGMMWRQTLADVSDPQGMLTFRVYTLRVNYTTCLQMTVFLLSAIILTL